MLIETKTLPSSGHKRCLLQQLPFLLSILPLSLSYPYFFRNVLYLLFFLQLVNLISKVNPCVCSHKPMGITGCHKLACSHETSHSRIHIKVSSTNHLLPVDRILVRLSFIWKYFSQLVLSSFEVFRNRSYLSQQEKKIHM